MAYKLTMKQVSNIRKRVRDGEKVKDLAIEFKVSEKHIRDYTKAERSAK